MFRSREIPIDDAAVITTMQSLGATSPERACRRSEIPAAMLAKLPELVDRGLLREAASDEYYLYVSSTPQLAQSSSRFAGVRGRSVRKRLLLTIVLWILIILVPIIMMQINGRRR